MARPGLLHAVSDYRIWVPELRLITSHELVYVKLKFIDRNITEVPGISLGYISFWSYISGRSLYVVSLHGITTRFGLPRSQNICTERISYLRTLIDNNWYSGICEDLYRAATRSHPLHPDERYCLYIWPRSVFNTRTGFNYIPTKYVVSSIHYRIFVLCIKVTAMRLGRVVITQVNFVNEVYITDVKT